MEELFQLKYGEKLKEETCGEEVFDFCREHGIEYAFQAIQI